MLRILLDEHISPVVARELALMRSEIEVIAVQTWEGGANIGLPDADMLQLAATQSLTLVTYDQRTIAPLLKEWAEANVSHGGVVFVDGKTVAPNDFGGLIRGLGALWDAYEQEDWSNWVIYLTGTG